MTTWLVGASSSAGVQIEPIAAPPPSGAVASAVVLPSPSPSPGDADADAHAGPKVSRHNPFAAWAKGMSGPTGVQARALQAYAAASNATDRDDPGCHLDWTTLAGVGYVESLNGEDGGSLGAHGRPGVAIYGPILNGSGNVAAVPDSDRGRIDADATVDRAVGPLQFLPSTWRTWGSDGDGDDAADPQDIDDAALSASRYLCAAGGDLSTAQGWTAAVFSYNHSNAYVAAVFAAANRIAVSSAP